MLALKCREFRRVPLLLLLAFLLCREVDAHAMLLGDTKGGSKHERLLPL